MNNEFAVDLDDLNPGVWFHFDEKEPAKGGFCVRPLDSNALDAISKETTTEKNVFKNGKRFRTKDVDTNKDRELTIDYTLPDWKVIDKDGKEIPCTIENKMSLICKSPWHQRFYTYCLNTALDIEIKHQQKAAKN